MGTRVMAWRLAVLIVTAGGLGALFAVPAKASVEQTNEGVKEIGALPARSDVGVLLGLNRSQKKLNAFVEQASDPGNKQYRKWLTVKQVSKRFGATPFSANRVRSYLRERGLKGTLDPTGAFIKTVMNGYDVQRIFGTRLGVFETSSENRFYAPLGSPQIPKEIAPYVDGVSGLDNFARVSPRANAQPRKLHASPPPAGAIPPATGTPSGCKDALAAEAFLPNQFQKAYSFDELKRRGYSGRGIRVALLEVEAAFLSGDLEEFAKCLNFDAPPVRVVNVGFVDPADALGPQNVEVTLDIEMVMAMAPGLESIDVYQGGERGAFAEVFAAMLSQKRRNTPDIISTSYGQCEAVWGKKGVPKSYDALSRDLMEWMVSAAGAVGIPVVAAAGDRGSSDCVSLSPALAGVRSVDLPAAIPQVLAVGGTSATLTEHNAISFEQVWNDLYWGIPNPFGGAGGGGESKTYLKPAYQGEAGIKGKGRSVPDVALYADSVPGWTIYCTVGSCAANPGWNVVGGTSAAAPLMASGLARIAQAAKKMGQPAIGPVNTAMYQIAKSANANEVFSDITFGNNDLYEVGCCSAAPGYDRASGWGSVDMGGLNAALAEAWSKRPRQ